MGDESEKPPVLDQRVSGRDLTRADFFSVPDGWIDGRFDVAGKKELAGIGGTLRDCQEDQDENHSTLELRLANNFSTLSMEVGQSDSSEASDNILSISLIGNGKYIDSIRVPFNQIETFSAPVKDVNALKMEVWIGGEKCEFGKEVGAVLMKLRVT